jgi:hypothetical protein
MAEQILHMRSLFLTLALLCASLATAAEPEVTGYFGRATGGKNVDIVRLAYRRALAPDARWWWPSHLQFGASAWWVPDISGTTHRYDVNVSAIWRAERGWWYFEGGFGPYFLSSTISNRTTSLPSELQFGSHVGAGVRLSQRFTVGVAVQHISNAGIEQPNGGIDFVQATAGYRF